MSYHMQRLAVSQLLDGQYSHPTKVQMKLGVVNAKYSMPHHKKVM